MKAKVKYFGMIAEKLHREEEILEMVPGMQIRSFLINKYPELDNMDFQIAINQEIKEEIDSNLKEIEIALLPPFAGG